MKIIYAIIMATFLLITGCKSSDVIDTEFSRAEQYDVFAEEIDVFFYEAAKSGVKQVSLLIQISGFGNQLRLIAIEIADIHGFKFINYGEERMGMMKLNFVRK